MKLINNIYHKLFGHKYKVTWKTLYGDVLEKKCTLCSKYKHRSCDYSDDPYLSDFKNGKHPNHPRELGLDART